MSEDAQLEKAVARQSVVSRKTELRLLILVFIGAVSAQIGVVFFPDQYIYPDWVPTALSILFLVELLIFAAKGGLPVAWR